MTVLHQDGTNEHGTREHDTTATARSGRYLLVVAAMVASMIAGLVIGWAVFGDGADPEPDTALTYVTPGAEELSPRQAEMVDVAEQYLAAWLATDGQRVEPLMIDTGYVEYLEQGSRFNVADGSLQQRISNGPYDSMENFSPMVVYDHRIVLTGSVNAVNVRWLSVIRFTTASDVKIVSETIFI